MIKISYHENDMELLMKFYTTKHSHYYYLVPLTKRGLNSNEAKT